MAVNRYVLTATVTIPPGAAATPVAGMPGTGAPAGPGSAATTGGNLWPAIALKGQVILLDPAGPVYAALATNLRPFVDGDIVGRAALSN
jgi:hypothetical protein